MDLPLPLHLSIHFLLAVLAGYFVGRHFKKISLGVTAGVLGGFFIDLDHILEYLLVFGTHFNLLYFFQGRQFLTSDKIHIFFHAWEYIPVIALAGWLFWKKKKIAAATFLLALATGVTVHLITDCIVNKYPPRNYSIIYRWHNDFSAKKLLSPEQYQKDEEHKFWLGIS